MLRLTCCCCGGPAPAAEQHWNRDRGFGLCGDCAEYIANRPDFRAAEFVRDYGEPNVNWVPKQGGATWLR